MPGSLQAFSNWHRSRNTPVSLWLAEQITQERAFLLELNQPQRGKR